MSTNERRASRRDLLRSDSGMTLVEVLVTTALSVVVLLAILGAADVFRTTVDATAKGANSQEAARSTLRDMVSALRQARVPAGDTTPVDHTNTSSSNDLVVAGWISSAGSTPVPGFTRYCVSSDGRSLLVGTRTAATWSAAGTPGACAVTAQTDTTAGWVYGRLVPSIVANTTSSIAVPLFSYTSDACYGSTGTACPPPANTVRSVGIHLVLVDKSSGAGRRVDQSATVSLRNRL